MIYIPLSESVLKKHKSYVMSKSNLKEELRQLKESNKDKIGKELLKFIITNLEQIICCKYTELKSVQNNYMSTVVEIVSGQDELEKNDTIRLEQFIKIQKEIKKVFLRAYEKFIRITDDEWNAYEYVKELDQTVCPYCNANFIQTIQASNHLKGSNSQARADLDHFLPKSIFPVFSLTLANLIPSCIYCNQRFKGEHYTNYKSYFSPFDEDIEKSISFRFNYSQDTQSNSFQKLKELENVKLDSIEENYLKMIFTGIFNEDELNKHRETSECLNEKVEKINEELNKIFEGNNKQLNQLVENIIVKVEEYIDLINKFMTSDKTSLNSIKDYAVGFEAKYQEFCSLRFIYESTKGKKGHNNIRRRITIIKENIKQHTKLFKIISEKESLYIKGEVDFVEVFLGESTNYQIEVIATSNDESIKRKVYNNASLFQIEEVYNQFRPYINRKIKQSYILSDLYKKQLLNQFPNLFNKEFDTIIDSFIVNSDDQRHEILGKLINDLIRPVIKSEENLQLLDISRD